MTMSEVGGGGTVDQFSGGKEDLMVQLRLFIEGRYLYFSV